MLSTVARFRREPVRDGGYVFGPGHRRWRDRLNVVINALMQKWRDTNGEFALRGPTADRQDIKEY